MLWCEKKEMADIRVSTKKILYPVKVNKIISNSDKNSKFPEK